MLDFLSDRENVALGVRLHCVQRKPTILHASAFVEGRNWDDSLLTDPNTSWKRQIIRSDHVSRVVIVTSQSAGAGKTRFIRKQLNHLQRNGDGIEIGSITVHEASTADSLADDVMEIFTENGKAKGLHVSFMCMLLPSTAETLNWLQSINLFFQSLFVHGVVRSHACSRSFHIGNGGWTVYVEFPSESGQVWDWLRTHIPILALCGEMAGPRQDFKIDDNTRRVCTYLRAYENGTIDRTFQKGSAGKRIVFVLDRSSSMRADIGNGTSALSAATDCALAIYDSHLQVNDVSFCQVA